MAVILGLLSGTTDTLVPVQVSSMGAISTMPGAHTGTPYTKFLTSAGDGTGNDNLNGNYAAAATDFFFQVPAGFSFDVYSLVIQISDATSFNQVDYGGITNGLTNGVAFFVNAGAGDIPLLSGKIMRQNFDWYRITPHITLTQWVGTPQTLAVALEMVEDFGMPLILDAGNKFIARLHDDLTGLVYHSFCLRGILHSATPAASRFWTETAGQL
jgi:hypothetical protein